VKEILNEEEESFSRTLERGEKMFEIYAKQTIIEEENGLDIDEEEYEKAKAESKEASKKRKNTGVSELVKLDVHDLGKLELMDEVPKTDDKYKYGKAFRLL
jgi:alanyl-tRNA synthetase